MGRDEEEDAEEEDIEGYKRINSMMLRICANVLPENLYLRRISR